ncbi:MULTISPECIES: Bcr/CflA family multidrug efflux MFS transporter [unclassified Vibrio]|uniref:Bcr/CflA family efflux transporter n=1 Tax=Vibrio sp. HB236076 TaxID=3232307 RepID=A0AB39HDE0_9VIBR|nr:Bcr/CflA family multidrug efflux MFS transporter [Vibrio sp. HB161653]MDP5253605.1 Bcr/CflA family multidrug efflux MFS transporter [Vibrio sp. HB161653]
MASSAGAAIERPKVNLLLFVILGAIGGLTPLAIDLYLPAMPAIATALNSTPGAVQLTLTAYAAGFAIGQLIHGPLADSYGRRPVLLLGIGAFALAAMASAQVEQVETLTFIRTLQGFAGAAAAVIVQAVVRDMFDREEFSRAMSFVTLVLTMAPLVAPLLGGHLADWFGWRAIFWSLALFSLLVIALVLWKIPETLAAEHRQPLKLSATLKNYASLLRNSTVMGLIFAGAFSFGGMFVFVTAGSFVYIEIYQIPAQYFGYLFGLNILSMIALTMVNSRLVRRMGSHAMLRLGLTLQLTAGIGLFFTWLLDGGITAVVVFVMLFIGTISMIGSNAMGLLLSGYGHMAGTASSLTGTLRFGMGSVMSAVVAALPGDKAWPMLFIMALCALCSASCYWIFGRKA